MKKRILSHNQQLVLQLDDFLPTTINLKLFFHDRMVKVYRSSSSNKIVRKVKANNFQKGIIKVSYGKRTTVNGKEEEFDNESMPLPKEELLAIFQAFLGH